ncbi:hypothetical protein ACHAQH_008975 [Verticillium albo-atrum]
MALASLRNLYTQYFPPKPAFTEKDVPSQQGRVFLITGGSSGIGLELCKMLYAAGGTVYLTSRSTDRVEKAMEEIRSSTPSSATPGHLHPLSLDLYDLESVKTAASAFQSRESRLDVLYNNAATGAYGIPPGTRTAQDLEPFIGTSCVSHHLLTTLLMPQLRAATKLAAPGSVRVVWLSSFLAEMSTPANGIDFTVLNKGTGNGTTDYAASKMGCWLLGRAFARRFEGDRVVSVVLNPGNVNTGAFDGVPSLSMLFLRPLLHEVKYGAYTELYAGLAPGVSNGAYVIPWGRTREEGEVPRKDLVMSMKKEEDGGLGYDEKFWQWCEEQYKPYL